MRTILGVFAVLVALAFVPTAWAQESSEWAAPRMEVYAGYDLLHTNFNDESGAYNQSSFNLNGGGGQFVYNVNNWVGAVSEVDGYSLLSDRIRPVLMTYLTGPRFTLHRGRLIPYVHTLFGGAYSRDAVNNTGYTNVFGMAVGGGAEVRVNRHLAVRPLQAEYFLMKFPDGEYNRQNGFRYSTGVIFNLGR